MLLLLLVLGVEAAGVLSICSGTAGAGGDCCSSSSPSLLELSPEVDTAPGTASGCSSPLLLLLLLSLLSSLLLLLLLSSALLVSLLSSVLLVSLLSSVLLLLLMAWKHPSELDLAEGAADAGRSSSSMLLLELSLPALELSSELG